MNCCWSCQREFGYWEVWRSLWRAGRPRIKCPSCGKGSFAAWSGYLLSFVSAFLWIVISIRVFFDLEVPLFSKLLIILFAGFSLSLPLPFVALYGKKPKDVEH